MTYGLAMKSFVYMHSKQFVVKFGLFSMVCLLLVFITHLGPPLSPFMTFSLSTLFLYVVLTISMYIFAKRAIVNPNPSVYTSLLLQFHWIRIFTSLIFVLTFISLFPPKSNLFLFPFFSIYILFTIFEVHMLTKLESHV